jgi:heptosyltransferase-2
MKILVILASGIGNSVLFGPALKILRKNYNDAEIDIFSFKESFAAPFAGSKIVDKIFYFKGIKTIFELRKQKYDVSITAFPSNKWQFNAFAFLVGAKKRVTHEYDVAEIKTFSFLQNYKVHVDKNIHDIEQNLNLLKAIGAEINETPGTFFHIDKESAVYANNIIAINNLEKSFIVGIHPGCNISQKGKRWDMGNFVELIDKICDSGKKCFLFAGPDEIEDTRIILEKIINKSKVFLINEKILKNVAALIKQCNCFLSNDSGLGHIAGAMGVRTVAISGPAMWTRTAPVGSNSSYIKAEMVECSPCLKYPFESTSSKIKCKYNYKCLTEIKVDDVYNALFS